ncbi:hypothetical protein Clacol_002478 [Clathrus columnatus]|uniref:J domain-containing protein n=1 Tax=Clathrus columnatus TaxID=1419009 RepID=A0AAV5A486_9AGAM|nr:hypothetical protein Clacol_002478 [Clathrus columnatus]
MVVDTTLYDLLGVSSRATEDEIRKAYRKKAIQHHPNPDKPDAAKDFQEIAAAYEILSDPDSRAAYDRLGVEGMAQSNGAPTMDEDFMENLFGGGIRFGFDFGTGAGARRRPSKGEDSVIPYDVTLEDLYNGKSVKMVMEREVVCSICKGSGGRSGAKQKPCIKCDGKGRSIVHTQGGRTVKEKKRQEIFIEKGMPNGHRIILQGQGDEEPEVPPGDVIFVLQAQQHASFERSGNDLLTKVRITLSEALLGFSRVLITHMDGRGVRVSSPPGKIIRPSETIILRGEGMPIYKQSDEKGDLFVVLELEMPSEQWLKTIDVAALANLLPPKKPELLPTPSVIDEARFERSDISAFGLDDEDAWEDEENDQFDDDPIDQCRHQ